jgi:hypothetical protein
LRRAASLELSGWQNGCDATGLVEGFLDAGKREAMGVNDA